ncbi:DUF490 domain-containing protein [Allopusillimonas soli]|uniref:Translocation/assembly module TamB domain-containing protein n=1 Tax=Allopusillimonas soli TaxID=659016 RepID=A0A853FB23_9BURK|nr:translocation/assembly module TamB domain-containing protein [Allopusillimonas soli]NYT35751.1 translocation/assembly module TamB domain-containing protein [Allopusillimonas soli]TEA76134.1 DUF490 domain-containing protein [Allopusillimonas soli]
MIRAKRWLRSVFIWVGPIVVLLLAVLAGFGYWVLATPSGTRWALVTAAQPFGATVKGVSGTVWHGLRVGKVDVALPDLTLHLDDISLQAQWRELLEGRLHVRRLSAGLVKVDLASGPKKAQPSEPFSMPQLPLRVAVDKLALGRLELSQDGEPIPVDIGGLATSVYLDNEGGQLRLENLDVGNTQMRASLEGEARVRALQDPWPMDIELVTVASGLTDDSPLCARNYLSTLPPEQKAAVEKAAGTPADISQTGASHRVKPARAEGKPGESNRPAREMAAPEAPGAAKLAVPVGCELKLDTRVRGNLDRLEVMLDGAGQGMKAQVQAVVTPRAAFPLQHAVADIQLADGSALKGDVNWETEPSGGGVRDRLAGTLSASKLDIGQLAGGIIPDAVLTMQSKFDIALKDRQALERAELDITFAKGSTWNRQALAGHFGAQVVSDALVQPASGATSAPASASSGASSSADDVSSGTVATDGPMWQSLRLAALDMDVVLGKNHLKAKGSLGQADSRLDLDLSAPQLSAFWPGLPGAAALRGAVTGSLARHKADLTARYTLEHVAKGSLGEGPFEAHLAVDGGWGRGAGGTEPEGWRGVLNALDASHAGMALRSRGAIPVSFVPGATAPAWQWQVGQGQIALMLDGRSLFVLDHTRSRGGGGRWETQGAVGKLVLSPSIIDTVRQKLGLAPAKSKDEERGGVKVRNEKRPRTSEITLGLDWNLRFDGVLEGEAHVKRLAGDLMVPAEPPFPLGLKTLAIDLRAKKAGAASSALTATLNLSTDRKGSIKATAATLLHADGGRLYLNPKDSKKISLDADIGDLDWLSLFTGDAMEFGGSLHAKLDVEGRPDGTWNSNGALQGANLKIVRIDDGIRLLDGTLAAHVEDNILVLDKLTFPARLRAKPKEWRTATWVSENPDAQGGSLTLTGHWDLFASKGIINADLYRYPILQRADRYAMITGKLSLDAELPRVAISGGITADAGWFDLDMLGGIPTVDGDVVVVHPGDEQKEASVPMDVSMELDVDLGPRFYLTGYGVNSGLIGKMHISMRGDKISAMGALHTRGGAIETYGQRLQLRRGTITFQGDITSPILDIEALRTGLAVEAGVRVAGTAKRPRIDLISYPAVSEIEKLSWLLLGHGPDESGGDIALLFSVGSSFLSDGEPFYRKFGIDEVSMRSGELGGAGSVLPTDTVVKGVESGVSDIENRFVQVSKGLGYGVTLSLRQALADTGTVAHLSYKLTRRLTAELSVGTVNGLALVHRWFSRD